MSAPRLFHYTCEDGARGIDRDGLVIPNQHPLLPCPLVWATDLDVPHREALGLTSFSLTCDRTAVRYEVPADDFMPWSEWARAVGLPRWVRDTLESAPGTMPRHWWVTTERVTVRPRRYGESLSGRVMWP